MQLPTVLALLTLLLTPTLGGGVQSKPMLEHDSVPTVNSVEHVDPGHPAHADPKPKHPATQPKSSHDQGNSHQGSGKGQGHSTHHQGNRRDSVVVRSPNTKPKPAVKKTQPPKAPTPYDTHNSGRPLYGPGSSGADRPPIHVPSREETTARLRHGYDKRSISTPISVVVARSPDSSPDPQPTPPAPPIGPPVAKHNKPTPDQVAEALRRAKAEATKPNPAQVEAALRRNGHRHRSIDDAIPAVAARSPIRTPTPVKKGEKVDPPPGPPQKDSNDPKYGPNSDTVHAKSHADPNVRGSTETQARKGFFKRGALSPAGRANLLRSGLERRSSKGFGSSGRISPSAMKYLHSLHKPARKQHVPHVLW
ncbi:hypothetical protein MMC32_004057 [Xylographa parallela]|nr:hypothetical protein [Xylographa parallela]